MGEIAALKETLVTASRILANEGLVKAYGHISVRIPDTDRFLISPRMSPALVHYEDILTMNLAGEVLEGKKPSNSEVYIHTCIYRDRPDVNSVSHTHSPMAVVLGVAGQTIQPISNAGVRFASGVPLFTKPVMIDNEQLGDEVAAMLGQHSAIMLKGHGAVIVGKELKQTCLASITLEEAAQLQFWATLIGKPAVYDEEEIKAAMIGKFPAPTPGSPPQENRAWDYYASKLSPLS
jgi:ribulose-5-phosphate 4-epimerase/fuculose-1-phosphate aldolase